MGETKKWICIECGYVHEGDYPPEYCQMCMAPREAFRELASA